MSHLGSFFTCHLPHYPAFFSIEIAGQQFVLEEIDPTVSTVEDQAFPFHQPIDLTVSNMTSFLNWFKDSLEGKLGMNDSADTVSGLTLPLDPATVEAKVSQVQEVIRSTFTRIFLLWKRTNWSSLIVFMALIFQFYLNIMMRDFQLAWLDDTLIFML